MKTISIVTLLVLLLCQTSRAGYVLQFSTDGLDTGRTVAVGESFSLTLYIAQNSPSTGLTASGLFSFGTRTTFSSAILQGNPGVVSNVFNPLFSDQTVATGQIDTYGALPSPSPTSVVIPLATFNFTALASGTTSLSFGDLDASLDDFTLNDATIANPTPTNLDNDLFGPLLTGSYNYQVTVTAVPEPSSALLMFAVSTALVVGRRWRKGTSLSNTADAKSSQ